MPRNICWIKCPVEGLFIFACVPGRLLLFWSAEFIYFSCNYWLNKILIINVIHYRICYSLYCPLEICDDYFAHHLRFEHESEEVRESWLQRKMATADDTRVNNFQMFRLRILSSSDFLFYFYLELRRWFQTPYLTIWILPTVWNV